ncbi:MAG: hypothetical protein KF745_07920 [Phycisphaeraceae bacterium]|nr:hypothetical protein [Phycisphaeraceae bacterium]
MTTSDAHNKSDLVAAWRHAAARAEVCEGLLGIYADVAAAISEREPVCRVSGRCCNFERFGHRLYATGLETAYTLSRVDRTDWGRAPCGSSPSSGRVITLEQVGAARVAGGCPFQTGTLCGVHQIRPLGCRVYFCDPTAQEWQQDLYEHQMTSLRALHDRFGIEYRYGEWREMLEAFA